MLKLKYSAILLFFIYSDLTEPLLPALHGTVGTKYSHYIMNGSIV